MKTLPTAPPTRDPKAFGLSDLLPPAMIKDLRQSVRSPLHLCLMGLGIALMYLFLEPRSGYYSYQTISNWGDFIFYATALLVVVVPIHMGRSLAGDIRERGSNFLQLCPLSAKRIIRGQFLSGAAQLFFLVLALGPLVHRFQVQASHCFSWCIEWGACRIPAFYVCSISMVMLYLIALFALAVMMMLACFPLFFRLLSLFWVSLISIVVQENGYKLFNRDINVAQHASDTLSLWVVVAILLLLGTVCALTLAKRHYSAFVEVRSGSLRLLSSLFLLAPLLASWVTSHEMNLSDYIFATKLAAMGSVICLLLDELMPRDALSPQTARPCLLNRCSSMGTLCSMAIILGLSCLLPHFLHFLGLFSDKSSVELTQASRTLSFALMSLFSATTFCLAIVNMILKPTSRARFVSFLITLVVVNIFSMQLTYLLQSTQVEGYSIAALPFAALAQRDFSPSDADFLCGGVLAGGSLLLFLLIAFIRSRSAAR